jgi:co-chaperonin GroES (HSP10)
MKNKLNQSGWRVPEYKVLLKPDVVEEKTKGGVILTQKIQKDEQNAKLEATIVGIGAKSFDSGTWEDKPNLGDRVMIRRYAGIILSKDQTADGHEYRIVMDREIVAIKENNKK